MFHFQKLLYGHRFSAMFQKEDFSKVIWNKLDYQRMESKTEAEECKRKLLTFRKLDAVLSFKLLWRCALDYSILQKRKIYKEYFLDVLKFLVGEVKDFDHASQQPCYLDPDSDTPGLKTIFESYKDESLKRSDMSVLNFTFESVPSFVFGNVSGDFSFVEEFIVDHCFRIIKEFPSVLYHIDDEGKTPLNNLLEKLLKDDLRKGIRKVANNGLLLDRLTTRRNVNEPDKDQVTPYSWILLCKKSLAKLDEPTLTGNIEDIEKHLEEKGAGKENGSTGLTMLRQRLMEGHLKRLMNLDMSKTTDESEIKILIMDLKIYKNLEGEGYGGCIVKLAKTGELEKFTKEHLRIRKAENLEISKGILEVMIDDYNAQRIYDIFKSQISSELNYSALFDVLKMCLEKGACPATDEIHEISLLNLDACTTYQAGLATVKMIEALIGAYRKQGNTEPINLHLNSIQGQWKVSEDLRKAAGAVIREAYGTLHNCLESKSVINTLLFLRKEDDSDNIEWCFEEADAIMQGENAEIFFPKWPEGERFSEMPYQRGKQANKILIKRNDNWLKRNLLHLAAIFCHDEEVLKCIPGDMMKKFVNKRDLHGCTPLHLAYLHDNQDAIIVLKSNGARVVKDNFGIIPQNITSSCTVIGEKMMTESSKKTGTEYTRDSKKMMTESSVYDTMKDRLDNEYDPIEKDLKQLFQRMTKDVLTAEIAMGGSVREKLRACRYEKYVLQIFMTSKRYHNKHFACLKLHEELVKKMGKINMKGISLRCIAVGSPWRFIWEGEGSCKGHEISVDVVGVFLEDARLIKQERQELIIDNAPGYKRNMSLKLYSCMEVPSRLDSALWKLEYDILTNLSPGCRLGILITKALLESLDQARESTYFWKKPITTYIVHHTLLWILAGKTPQEIEKEYGNVMGGRYGALRQKLHYKENDPKWMTAGDLVKYAEDGRFWAEKIFDAIQFVAETFKKKLGNFLLDRCHDLADSHEKMDVLDTCKTCLERLRPDIFFAEKKYESGESNLRTRLQQVIDRLNVEAEKVPGVLLWKKKKEVKELKIRIANCWQGKKEELERTLMKLQMEIDKLTQKYASQEVQLFLQEEEREKVENAIQQSIMQIGRVNQEESLLFRLRGEVEMNETSFGLWKRQKGKQLEKEIKAQCEELEKETKELFICCSNHLQKLEENLKLLFNDQTEM